MSARKFLGWRPWWGEEKGALYQNRNEALQVLGNGIDDRDFWRTDDNCRLKKVYAKKKRTAEEERADVVAWLEEYGPSASLAQTISAGFHVGEAKKGSVATEKVDADAATCLDCGACVLAAKKGSP